MDLYAVRHEIVLFAVLGVIAFSYLSRANEKTLLATAVMGGVAYVGYMYLRNVATNDNVKTKEGLDMFEKDGSVWRREANSDSVFVATFPKKGFRFLKENGELQQIAKEVLLCRMFDRARYSDLLLHMDQYQKVYMYILDGRFQVRQYVPIFFDLRTSILEILYSMYFVVPEKTRHVYGVEPHKSIAVSIERFMALSQTMASILRSYSKKTIKEPYFPDDYPEASDQPFDAYRSRRLP
jgi:hypothetical protein